MTPQQNTAPPTCRACGHVALVSITQVQRVERNASACRPHSELHDILSANAMAIRARGDA